MDLLMAGVDVSELDFYQAFFEEYDRSTFLGPVWEFLGLTMDEYRVWCMGYKTLVQIAAERRGT